MKRLFIFFAMVTSLCGQVFDQDFEAQNVPPEITAAAVAAVADLGKEVVLGKYQVAIDRMYPQWKNRTAKKMGGIDKLEEQLAEAAQKMLKHGITIIESKPHGTPRPYEVYPGKKMKIVDGKAVESLRYTKWLVLVPTLTRFRILVEGDPAPINIESTGFQVAVCEKDSNVWSFIDGSSVSVSDLRGLFLTIPQDLILPPLEKKQIK